jgi:uncharacterized integral membrane protein
MVRFILVLVFLIIYIVFAIINLGNNTALDFGFGKLENVPISLTVLISFVLGLLCATPLIFIRGKKTRHKGLLSASDKIAKKAHKELEVVEPAAEAGAE